MSLFTIVLIWPLKDGKYTKFRKKSKNANRSFFPCYIGNTDNVVVPYKAHIQNEICLSLAVFASKVKYTLKYYFVARRLELARVSFAVFNGYCRFCFAVYGRLTKESSARDVRGKSRYNCFEKVLKRGISRSSLFYIFTYSTVMTLSSLIVLFAVYV